MPQRSSDVAETFASNALLVGVASVLAIGLGALFVGYKSMFMLLGIVLIMGGALGLAYVFKQTRQIKQITSNDIVCPYCSAKNIFTEPPTESVTCQECSRLIPIFEGRILKVSQVRCGYCRHLNYYNEHSVGLICENCDREIPIATADGELQSGAFHKFVVKDDTAVYDLVLRSPGPKVEEVIPVLQQMLALNRNQVKQMLEETPVTLLTGIPKMKAEMLTAQLQAHDADARFEETKMQV